MGALDSLFPPPRRARPLARGYSPPADRPLTVSLVGTRDEGPRSRLLSATAGRAAAVEADVCLVVGAADLPVQGYRLRVGEEGVSVLAADEGGLWNAVATLRQLIRVAGSEPWSGCEIEDEPAFPVRGVMLDVSRDRVPRTEALRALIDRLADLKVNQLQLYTEHTFAYAGHEPVWRRASPFTPSEVRELDDFCHERGVELVPNQQSFGHWHRWLTHPDYANLAEHPPGIEHAFSVAPQPYGLNPTDPRTIALLEDLYDQLLPCFRSRTFNVGLDEPLDLGLGASRSACAGAGKGAVYLEFLRQVHARVEARDHRMQFWGDAILEYPDLVDQLPQDAVALEWGYEAGHPFDAHAGRFAASGLEFYVCPGTSSWQGPLGRTGNVERNLAEAAQAGARHGATGYLVTDWGDFGHWQPPDVSLPGLLLAAGHGWRAGLVLARADWAGHLDRHLPPTEADGATLLALGDVSAAAGSACKNAAPWFYVMRYAHQPFPPELAQDVTANRLQLAREALAGVPLPPGALSTAAAIADWGCRLGVARAQRASTEGLARELEDLLPAYREGWLRTSRSGGLDDSVGRLEALVRLLS
jgi:hexosaminidase